MNILDLLQIVFEALTGSILEWFFFGQEIYNATKDVFTGIASFVYPGQPNEFAVKAVIFLLMWVGTAIVDLNLRYKQEKKAKVKAQKNKPEVAVAVE